MPKVVPLPVTTLVLIGIEMVPVLVIVTEIVPVLAATDEMFPVQFVPREALTTTPGNKVAILAELNAGGVSVASKATFASALSDERRTLITEPVYVVLSWRRL